MGGSYAYIAGLLSPVDEVLTMAQMTSPAHISPWADPKK